MDVKILERLSIFSEWSLDQGLISQRKSYLNFDLV